MIRVLLAIVVAITSTSLPAGAARGADPVPASGDFPWNCGSPANPIARADELLAGRYAFYPFRTVTLPLDLTWREDPFHDRNWQLQEHNLYFTLALVRAWHDTGNLEYRERARSLILDWIKDNPRSAPRSEFSWGDHSTALRAIVLVCAARELDMAAELRSSMTTHAALLASPSFYRGYGNHSLDQSLALFDLAVQLGRTDWRALAVSRITTLLAQSVDTQGVTNEQSVGYEGYNYRRYLQAWRRIVEAGLTLPSVFSRLSRMPDFLAYATLPNGEYEMIGDTDRGRASVILGTRAEFAATQGASGVKPASTVALYSAGYLFARSGWGETRPYADEVALSVRFGPARIIHGHDDQASLTFYGYGTKLLLDAGRYTYNSNRWRTFFTGRTAHNVVTVDGLPWTHRGTTLRSSRISSSYVDVRLKTTGYPGVTLRRRITYSRRLDWMIVEDQIISASTHKYRQLWHLAPDSAPTVTSRVVTTHRSRGNLVIRQLTGSPTTRIVTGRTSPIQGWHAPLYAYRVKAPTVEAIRIGRSVRYITLIVPGATGPHVRTSNLQLLSDGYAVTVTVNGRSERVRVNGSSVSITTP